MVKLGYVIASDTDEFVAVCDDIGILWARTPVLARCYPDIGQAQASAARLGRPVCILELWETETQLIVAPMDGGECPR